VEPDQDNLQNIRKELSIWLDANWDPDRSLVEWRDILLGTGWAAPGWPREYFGRGYNAAQVAVVEEVFREKKAIGAAAGGPGTLASGIILAEGTEGQKQRYLKPLLTGQHKWCQLFSEPGSGSDLAGLSTKAELVGENWIINGQKVWTTSAHHADFGLLLARTDWDVPKHQGISYFLINMRQPGIDVRPLRQMNGYASFNEVFITDATVHIRDMVGKAGDGWRLASTTLSFERQKFVATAQISDWYSDENGRIYLEYRKELDDLLQPYVWYPQRAGRVDLIMPRARETGAIADPVIRQEIAKLICLNKATEIAAAAAEEQSNSGADKIVPAGSISKIARSEISRQAAHVHTLISGIDSLYTGPDAPEDGLIAEILLSSPAMSIAGGTDEIQKNIISERVLGLPKEARVDTGPFRDIPHNLVSR